MSHLVIRVPESPRASSDARAAFRPALRHTAAVILCAYTMDRWEHLCMAVQSVHAQSKQPLQTIIVIDHDARLFARARARFAHSRNTVVIENAAQPGLSGARNTGIANATADVVAFLDDDASADQRWLEHLVAAYEDEHVVAVGGRIVPIWESDRPGWFPDEFDWVLGCTYRGMPDGRTAVRNIIGANMSFRRSILEEVGGFSSELGRTATQPLGDEETEACIRARRLRPGNVVLYEPEALVGHWVPDTRTTHDYFRARCRGEGISKACMTKRLGERDGLSSERTHVLKTLPAGVIRNMKAGLKGQDEDGVARARAIIEGLAYTVAGYASGKARMLMPARLRRTAVPSPAPAVPSTVLPRILVVTPRYPPLSGGVENHVVQTTKRLAENAEITVLTTDPSRSLPPEECTDGVRVVRVPAWPRKRDYYIAPSVFTTVARGGWDLVHVQSYHTAVAPLAMLGALKAGIPYVLTFHGGGHSSPIRRSLRGVQQAVLRPLLTRAHRLIAVAEFEAATFSSRLHIPRDRFVTIPNGSDLPRPDGQRRRVVAQPGGHQIVSIGRLEEYKGHHRVVEAMPEILRRVPDAELLILGSGPYQREIEATAKRLGVTDRVRIRSIPASERAEMAATLEGAALVTLMSSFETHPLAVIEAIALGRPALVADTSGLRELAEAGLARAIPLDSDAMAIATAVIKDLEHPREVPAVAVPTWDECAAGVQAVYTETIEDAAAHERETTARRRAGRRVLTVSALAGLGMLAVAAADSASRLGAGWAAPLWWAGLVLLFAPAVLTFLSAEVSRGEALGILAVVGLALYAVKVLDNPTLFAGYDELMHYRTIDDIIRTGRLFAENPLLPISPSYPGLEIVTHAVMSLTGMPAFASGVIVVGAARLVGSLALYLLLERLGLTPSLAGLGTLLYATSPSALFFNAQFAYESLALPLAILCLYVLRVAQLEQSSLRRSMNALAMLLVTGVALTHHVTSYALAGVLMIWLVIALFYRSGLLEPTPGSGWVPPLAVATVIGWFGIAATTTAAYLLPHVTSAVSEAWRIIAGETASRRLFQSVAGQTAPLLERLIGLAAVALVLACIPFGVRWARAHSRKDVLAFMLTAGALAYPAALALRFTTSGWQVGSRALAFIYVGLAFVLAAGVDVIRNGPRIRIGRFGLTALIVIMFAGGVIAGSSPQDRIPAPYTPGAGSRSVEVEGLGAAAWTRTVLGPGHRIAGDFINSSLVGSYGRQRTISSEDEVSVSGLFLAPEFAGWQRTMISEARIEYAIVDRRIAGVTAPQGFFYEKWERDVIDYGSTVTTETIGRFDTFPRTSRVFDSGNIQLYDVRVLAR